MKENFRKNAALILVLIVICGVCIMFSCRKSGMFIDEIYTYGLSNSHYAPFLDDCMGGTLEDTLVARQDLLDYVTVNSGEKFDFGSVYYNQVNDVHPPLYYWLFNIVSSFTPNVYSKWTGLCLDLVIFMLAVIMLYRLVYKLFGSRDNAVIAAALYGLSTMGLSTMLMIRMYVLLTLFTVSLAYLIACQMKEPSNRRLPLIGLNIFLGLMTQYYFVFYAFFLCAAYLIYALVKKQYKTALFFALWAFAGVGLLVLVFPACLSHLFADKLVSGSNALENLEAVGQYKGRIVHFCREMGHGLKAGVWTAAVTAVLLAAGFKKLRAAFREGRINFDALVIIVPAAVTLIIVALISPVVESRYVYNIAPIFITAVSFLIYLAEQSFGSFKNEFTVKKAASVLAMLLALWFARCYPPMYIYPEHADYNKSLSEFSDSACVYITDNYFAPVTQDLNQLLNFNDFFISGRTDSPALLSYLDEKGSSECVVYVDRDPYWSSGFVPEKIMEELLSSTDYSSYENIYCYGLSAAYLLRK